MVKTHAMQLAAPRLFGGGTAPVLLERTETTFMAAVRDELCSSPDRVRQSRVPKPGQAALSLYQPIHRVFHVVVVAATCDEPGRPRVNPLKVESAGLVVRRLADDGSEQGWLRDGDAMGWATPDVREDAHALPIPWADPDPSRRRRRSSGRPELDAMIAALRGVESTRAEAIVPLFPLAPSECEQAGETLIYGFVPTASLELEQAGSLPSASLQEFEQAGLFPAWLLGEPLDVPRKGMLLTGLDVLLAGDVVPYVAFVRELVVTFALESAGAKRLRELLADVKLSFADNHTRDALTHLREAARLFVRGEATATVTMPTSWPTLDTATAKLLRTAAFDALEAKAAGSSASAPRFGQRDAQYVVRAFMRVRRDDGCAPELVWSQPSAPFTIAPWFAGSPVPRPIIELPNPLRDGLDSIKPNVAFAVPSMISDLLGQNDPADLLAGKGKQPKGSGITWICSFSIPIITLCAFILLSLLISLLNFFFWWLPFVKICLPLPKSSQG